MVEFYDSYPVTMIHAPYESQFYDLNQKVYFLKIKIKKCLRIKYQIEEEINFSFFFYLTIVG